MECTNLKTDVLDQDQKNMIPALTNLMLYEATGESITPEVTEDKESGIIKVCFKGTSADVPKIIDDALYAAKYAEWKADQDAKTAKAEADAQTMKEEKEKNQYCDIPLSVLEQKIDAQLDSGLLDLLTFKSNVKIVLKELAKCFAAKTYSGNLKS